VTDAATIELREVQPGDVSGIVALDALRSEKRKRAWWCKLLERYGSGKQQDGRVALVAADARGRVHGFLFGEVRAWEFGSERCGWVFSVAVSPTQERTGLATRLCREAMKRFGAMGVDLVRTMVRRNDVPMLAFFRSMGFHAGPFSELQRRIPVAARKRSKGRQQKKREGVA
jgi:ribosomal protein S18 acetylase RimI-like enzyme